MEFKIWNWPYQTYVIGMMLLEIVWILSCLISAKVNKSHTIFHLFAGVFLIFGGCVAIALFDSGLVLISNLASEKLIDTHGASEANMWLKTLSYVVPAISIAFGTRFVGNWITAEKPSSQERA